MSASQQLRVVWGYRWWLLLVAVVAAAAAYLVSSQQDDVYEARALAQIVSGRQATGEFVSPDELQQVANVYAEIARTTVVAERAQADAEPPTSTDDLKDRVTISPQPQLEVIQFEARSGSSSVAAGYANAYAEAFADYVDEIETGEREDTLARIRRRAAEIEEQLRELGPGDPAAVALNVELEALTNQSAAELARPGDTVRIIQPAQRPDSPASPKPARDAVLAFLAALVVGAVAAYVRFRVTDHFSSAEEAALELDLPVLAHVPLLKEGEDQVREAFRSLRTTVSFALREASDLVLVVTSAEAGEGKSFTAAKLATSFALDDRKVVVVDADLPRASLHEQFKVPSGAGLGDVLRGWVDQPPVVHLRSVEAGAGPDVGLDLIPAGSLVEYTAEMLSSERMSRLVGALRQEYQVVIFDSPPVLSLMDAVILGSRYAGGVVLVVDARRTRRREARRALQALRAIEAPVIGLVFNRSSEGRPRYRYADASTRASRRKERAATKAAG
jgi:succinoglycan biosynthesis transport protein ExoP